jgi:Xaa-Pro aminopeptidase
MVDHSARAERLDAYLAATGYEAVWFARPNAFAWLTGGSNVVDREDSVGVAAAGYVAGPPADGSRFRAVAPVGDAARIAEEELPDGFDLAAVPWHTSLGEAIAERSPGAAAADFDAPGLDQIDPGPLRQPLSDDDIERYRQLGEETAAAVERVCRELTPEDTEHEVASALRITLSSGDVEAPVVRVAGSERAGRYRAPPAGGAELGDYAVVNVTSARSGLHASLSRTVAFDPSDGLRERFHGAARVEATALAATQAAAESEGHAGEVFEAIQDAYIGVGQPDEWEAGDQGGAAGFARREWLAGPDTTPPVTAPMGYAWNPTIGGARSEDTYLVEAAGAGLECLTATPNWPTRTVSAVGFDREIERHAILEP